MFSANPVTRSKSMREQVKKTPTAERGPYLFEQVLACNSIRSASGHYQKPHGIRSPSTTPLAIVPVNPASPTVNEHASYSYSCLISDAQSVATYGQNRAKGRSSNHQRQSESLLRHASPNNARGRVWKSNETEYTNQGLGDIRKVECMLIL